MMRKLIKAIALIEVIIGLSTLLGLTVYSSLSMSEKPLNVLIFVIVSSIISISIGSGLFKYRDWARRLLILFSGYIVIIKILIFSGLLQFKGEIMTFIPTDLKNYISILYHSLTLIFFNQISIKKNFVKGRNPEAKGKPGLAGD